MATNYTFNFSVTRDGAIYKFTAFVRYGYLRDYSDDVARLNIYAMGLCFNTGKGSTYSFSKSPNKYISLVYPRSSTTSEATYKASRAGTAITLHRSHYYDFISNSSQTSMGAFTSIQKSIDFKKREYQSSDSFTVRVYSESPSINKQGEFTLTFPAISNLVRLKTKADGNWKNGIVRVKAGDTWKYANGLYVKVDGEWIQVT